MDKIKSEKYLFFGDSKIGNRNENQDQYLMIQHKKNPDLALVAVFDGVGGSLYGKEASKLGRELLRDYFNNNDVFTKESVINAIANMNYLIHNNTSGFTTLSMAIINKDKVIVANVGDSRTYSINKGLSLVTEDDSRVYEYYRHGLITLDDIRFVKTNNIITGYLGDRYLENIQVKEINLKTGLLLTTDGVHDVLSMKRMFELIKNNREDKIISSIINSALTEESEVTKAAFYRILLKAKLQCEEFTTPGKDNTTAVLLLKR